MGSAVCVRCGLLIAPAALWELDHRDDGLGYNGPAHRSCNRRAGQAKGAAMRRAAKQPEWRMWSRCWYGPDGPADPDGAPCGLGRCQRCRGLAA